MAMISEKVVVTAKEFLEGKNINDNFLMNEPLFRAKMSHFDWDLPYAAASIGCEIIWRNSVGKESITDGQRLDRLFSPSPVSTHCNFRGCRSYKTGNVPEPGSIAIWRKGYGWQGNMAIVLDVSDDKETFSVAECRVMQGGSGTFLSMELKQKKTTLPFRNDKLNLVGFIYPPDREIK